MNIRISKRFLIFAAVLNIVTLVACALLLVSLRDTRQAREQPATDTTSAPKPMSSVGPGQVVRVKYQSGRSYLIIEFLDDDLVHLELSALGPGHDVSQPIYTTPMVRKTDYAGPSRFADEGSGTLETSDIRIRVDSRSLCVTATDKTKNPELVLSTLCPFNLDKELKGLTLTPASFTNAYGLGEKFITAGSPDGDWVGRPRSPGKFGNAQESWNYGSVGNDQFPIAYLAGKDTDNYALFFDNQYRQLWGLTGDPWKVTLAGDWIRFYLMTGPDLEDLRKDFLELVGRPPVPPKKALGLWISEYGFDNWTELEDKLRTLRANHFPVDGFVLDLQWYGGIKQDSDDTLMGAMAWDLKNFDPKSKIASLKEKEGIGLVAIEEPYVGKNLPEYAKLESSGYLVKDCEICKATYLVTNPWWGKGGMIDFTNDAAASFWHDWKREPLIEAGLIGHWTDLGEPEAYNPNAWYWGLTGDHKPLHSHADVHNLYNLKWAESIYEGYIRNNHMQRPFILSRSGAPGIQRFGVALWSGDISGHLTSLATHLNVQMHMSMSGIDYYGADIGGFFRSKDYPSETYTQWFANGMAFDVPGRVHVFNFYNNQETTPDRVGDLQSNLENVRQRYELSPYLYSLAHRAYLHGEPMVPPLVYYYQSDPQVRTMGGEKLLGRDLLVAAVAKQGEREHKVYLPAGEWINYHTGEWLKSSGQWFGPFALYPDGKFRLPMFARAGAIIPQMWVDDQTMNIMGKRLDGSNRNELIVRVYADGAPSEFSLYEDDGESIAYQKGLVRTTIISQQQSGKQITVTIAPASGDYVGAPTNRDNVVKLYVNNPGAATRVSLDGAGLTQYSAQAELDAASSGWYGAGDNLVIAKSGDMAVSIPKIFVFEFPASGSP